jgi:hypothetical protein
MKAIYIVTPCAVNIGKIHPPSERRALRDIITDKLALVNEFSRQKALEQAVILITKIKTSASTDSARADTSAKRYFLRIRDLKNEIILNEP